MKAVKIVYTAYNALLLPSVMLFLRKLFSWWNIAKYPAYSYFQQLSNPLSFLEPCITQYLWQSCKEKKGLPSMKILFYLSNIFLCILFHVYLCCKINLSSKCYFICFQCFDTFSKCFHSSNIPNCTFSQL